MVQTRLLFGRSFQTWTCYFFVVQKIEYDFAVICLMIKKIDDVRNTASSACLLRFHPRVTDTDKKFRPVNYALSLRYLIGNGSPKIAQFMN